MVTPIKHHVWRTPQFRGANSRHTLFFDFQRFLDALKRSSILNLPMTVDQDARCEDSAEDNEDARLFSGADL